MWDSGERDEYTHAIKEAVGESDFDGIKQLWNELTSRQKSDIWKAFDGAEQVVIKEGLRNIETDK